MKLLFGLLFLSLSTVAQDYNTRYQLGLKIGTDSSLNFRMPFKKYDFIQVDLHRIGDGSKLSSTYNTYLKPMDDFDPYVGLGAVVGNGPSGIRVPIGANYKINEQDLLFYGEASGDITGEGIGLNVMVGINYLF